LPPSSRPESRPTTTPARNVFLGQHTTPLAIGMPGPVSWLPDGRFWYRTTTEAGAEFVMIDPAQRTRSAAFDHARLATALGAATGETIDASRLRRRGGLRLRHEQRRLGAQRQPGGELVG
jgi:hypothetical protein